MEFFDKKERDANEEVFIIKTPKEVTEYPSRELVRELAQNDKNSIYKIRAKDLKVGDGFYNAETVYVTFRIK